MDNTQDQPGLASQQSRKIATPVEKVLPWIVLVLLCLFIAASSYSAYDLAQTSELGNSRSHLYEILPFIVFVMLALAYSGWFIICFTGDVTDEKKRQIFRFAYAFTITAFVILMTPVANPWQPDVIGPISLLRGCVLAPVGDEASVPGAIRCARAESAFLPASVRQNFVRPVQPAQPLSGDQHPEVRCVNASEKEQPCVESDSYPWLVTLGGFNGVVIHDGRLPNGKQTSATVPPREPMSVESNSRQPFAMRTSIVQGGFVVPFYVVLIAFIGGAVSLARRIPEYQKRSGAFYVPTSKQPELKPLEVREVVVFQVMQLISAPLIAVVAFYALSPSTMSAAIGLAFLSGFASELVLLQIRGVVEGLQPHVTAMTNPVNEPLPPTKTDVTSPDPIPGNDGSGNRGVPSDDASVSPEGLSMASTSLSTAPSQGPRTSPM